MEKVRVTFRVETVLDGETIEECRSKFENTPLRELPLDYVELVSVEDAETYADKMDEWEGNETTINNLWALMK